ncbi:MAG: hypothetical protein RMJ51_03385 [Candidatus Calescibacterium sp.]|nr:hypothetical protein [Candidatus Calescibacterium sp.]MCX7971662.1 hypothetical protein [bacterium]MDW8195268.1 hypothetical protein [Candidatus Calescibacterium sp.]
MIFFLVGARFALEIPTENIPEFNPNKIYVIKFKNIYFLGFFMKTKKNLERKLINVRKINFIDFLIIPNWQLILSDFESLINSLPNEKKSVFRYMYLGLEKIALTLVKYEDILKIYVNGIIENYSFNKKIQIESVEHNYLDKRTCFSIKASKNMLKSDNLKKIIRYFQKKLGKRIKYEIGYRFEFSENVFTQEVCKNSYKIFDFIHKKQKLTDNTSTLVLVHDLEKIISRNGSLQYDGNVWINNLVANNQRRNYIFPLWGIILSAFFENVVLDYFPGFSMFYNFLHETKSNVIFHSFLPVYGNYKNYLLANKHVYLQDFEKIRQKLVFENFSLKDLKNYLATIVNDAEVVFYSFYDAFYKFYCGYCGNIPFCEMCKSKLTVSRQNLDDINKIKLVCKKCKVKYDTFNCQYCGKYLWKLWKRKYKEEMSNYNTIFINFLPSDFSSYLKGKDYIVVLDYFSLYKPFVLKELNIWYLLFKIINELNVKNIFFVNAEEFNVFEYFHNFVYSDRKDVIIDRLVDLIEMERKIMSLSWM